MLHPLPESCSISVSDRVPAAVEAEEYPTAQQPLSAAQATPSRALSWSPDGAGLETTVQPPARVSRSISG
jgi:hypothetical protein